MKNTIPLPFEIKTVIPYQIWIDILSLSIINLLQLSDKSKDEKEDDIKTNEAEEAMNAMKHVTDLVVQMDESLKEEEDILNERASRLRRQSADAFKLIDDVKKLQK